MAYVKTDDTHYKNIADVLRETLGEDSVFMPLDMGEAIRYANEVSYFEGEEQGYNAGMEDGFVKGFEEGEEYGYQSGLNDGAEDSTNAYEDGREAGKKAQHDEFWNNSGKITEHRFEGTFWTQMNFKPNKDIKVGKSAFSYHNWKGTSYDLAEHLESLGVSMILDTNANEELFYYAWFNRLPELDFSACAGPFNLVFFGMAQLVTIDKIILPLEGAITENNQPFYGCTKLENIIFEGVFDRSISFVSSPLSVASLKNIITHLKDFTGTEKEHRYTITFKTSAFNVLEAEGNTAPNGKTWSEYIDDLKWNLVKG